MRKTLGLLALLLVPCLAAALPNPAQIAQLRWYEANTGECFGGWATPCNQVTLTGFTSQPWGIAFDGANMWVSGQGGQLAKVRAADGVLLSTITLGGTLTGVAFDGLNVWVADSGGSRVFKVRASDGYVYNSAGYPVGSSPMSVVFDGLYVWTVDNGGTVTKLKANGDRVAQIQITHGAWGGAFDGTNVWVTSGQSPWYYVWKIRASDNSATAYNIGFNNRGVVFDGSTIWVASMTNSQLLRLNPADGTILATITNPLIAMPISLAFDGTNIWVVGLGSGLTKIRAADNTVIGQYRSPLDAMGVAFDGANMWVPGTSGPGTPVVQKL